MSWLSLPLTLISHGGVKRPGNNLLLVRTAQAVEVHSVPADSDGELGVQLGVVHGVHQGLAGHDVDVEVLRAARVVEVPRM